MIAVFAIVILGHQFMLLFTKRRFDPLDVKVLIDIVLFVMWVYAPLVDSSLRFKLEEDLRFAYMTLAGIIFLYIGLHLPLWRTRATFKWSYDAPILRMRWFWLALLIFVGATLLVTFQKAQYSGVSILGYIVGDRLSSYQTFLNEANDGSMFAGRFIGFTTPIVLMWMTINLNRQRWKWAAGLYLVLLIGIVLIATARLPIIITLLLPIAYYYRRNNRTMSIQVAALLGIAFIVLMFLLNIWRTWGFDATVISDLSLIKAIDAIAMNFNPIRGYEKLWNLYRSDQLPSENGLSYLYIPLTAIPRTLWAAKPLVSFEPRWTTYLFGQHFAVSSEGIGVWTFTVWGEGLVQFGVFGVMLNMFLYGSLVTWAESRFGRHPSFFLVWFYYSILAATYLRSSFSALAWTFLAGFLPLMFVYILSIRQPARTNTNIGGRLLLPSDSPKTTTIQHRISYKDTK